MFGYNLSTLIIILVIALCCFGPKRLPELGESIGKAIKGFKKAHDDPESVAHQERDSGASTAAAQSRPPAPSAIRNYSGEFAFCPHCGQRAPRPNPRLRRCAALISRR